MSAKKIVQDFYKSDALIDAAVMAEFLHPEIILEWNSTKGFLKLGYDEIISLTENISWSQSLLREGVGGSRNSR